ncbi:MAG: hypothetical protein ACTSXO_09955 [Candidatus Heimdallarchaeota archaeon]|nr:MAG: hypothetical protein DRP02_12205 [Candidatus Gerdarchaeota archaeon]RLI68800.1 MAG: hypothetical protein DRO63_02020 [Candidatus Gerdarchaeota archaeon]RLI74159.1 MAG: hypothetical protein DRO91_01245 [Candidatus Heimdallarchaeota archaeon]
MTAETNPPAISKSTLEITHANSFQELSKAYEQIEQDFKAIVKTDEKGYTKTFVARYQELSRIAQELIQKKNNGTPPTIEELAIFGEMAVLRDFCLKRLEKNRK